MKQVKLSACKSVLKIDIDGKAYSPISLDVTDTVPADLNGVELVTVSINEEWDCDRLAAKLSQVAATNKKIGVILKATAINLLTNVKFIEENFSDSVFGYFINSTPCKDEIASLSTEYALFSDREAFADTDDFDAVRNAKNRFISAYVDGVTVCAKSIKEIASNKLVGAYLLRNTDFNPINSMIGAIINALSFAENIDMICSPSTNMHSSDSILSSSGSVYRSLAKRNKVWFVEIPSSLADNKEEIEAITTYYTLLSKKKEANPSEVLLITDEKSWLCVNENNLLYTICLKNQFDELRSMGAGYDIYSASDIDEIDLNPYKLIVFLDAFDINDSVRNFIDQIKTSGKTVLWIYAPDYVSGGLGGMQHLTDINIVKLIGDEDCVHTHFGRIDFDYLPQPRFFIEDNDVMPLGIYPNTEKVAIGMKRFSDWTSIYSAVGNINANTLCNIARIAGVHIAEKM